MLNLLIENFDKHFLPRLFSESKLIDECLRQEFLKLSDIDHLESNVIGTPQFQWDYRAVAEGFLNLLEPYMRSESFIPHFFLYLLRDLGIPSQKYILASILIEYSYYSMGVNDAFNFHPCFTEDSGNLGEFAEQTQIKYAAQYLANYPRYLLINNVFEIDDAMTIQLHKLLANVTIVTGVGRGVFLKWSYDHYRDLCLDYYLQNSINILYNFFVFPVEMAALFANIPQNRIAVLKKAFSAFSLLAKLRLEKNIYQGNMIPEVDPPYDDTLRLFSFPGLALVFKSIAIDDEKIYGSKYPSIRLMHGILMDRISRRSHPAAIKEIEILEEKYARVFLSAIDQSGLLGSTTALLRRCFDI